MSELIKHEWTDLVQAERRSEGSDARLIDLWLRSKGSENTRIAYERDITDLMSFTQKNLWQMTLSDLLDWKESLDGAPATIARKVKAVRSLFNFASKVQYVTYNVASAMTAPKPEDTLAQKILTEEETKTLITTAEQEDNPMKYALIRFLYNTGGRVEEVIQLEWRSVRLRKDGSAQVTLYGKGGKTKNVLISKGTYDALIKAKTDKTFVFASPTEPDQPISRSTAFRYVKAVGIKAGLGEDVSPHWLRHAHASHALDRGATVAEVRDGLGHSSIAITNRYVHARPQQSSGSYLDI